MGLAEGTGRARAMRLAAGTGQGRRASSRVKIWRQMAIAQAACLWVGFKGGFLPWLLSALFVGGLVYLFIRDVTQKQHTILRNYPVIGHLRYYFEELGEDRKSVV